MVNLSVDKNFDYFLNNSFANYTEGEWIAIYEDKVIAHDSKLKEVIKEAKKVAPITKVLISKVKKTMCYL